MLTETQNYLDAADRNYSFARDVANAFGGARPSREWAVVIAFYAAVHYINAYVWERLQYEPSSHEERTRMLATTNDLKPLSTSYRRFLNFSFRARYDPTFRIALSDLQDLIDTDLAAIEQHARALLVPTEDDS